jgi:AraC-like DNA-binding protein
MAKSALRQITALPNCGGGLSRLVYAYARHHGADPAKLLHRAGLTVGEIQNRDAQIGVAQQIRFVQLVADALGDENLGIHLAQTYDLREAGLLYYVAASADTLGQALCRIERYSTVANQAIRLSVKKAKSVRVGLYYAGVARHTDVHQIEFWIFSIIRICRELTKRELSPVNVHFMHRRDGDKYEIARLADGKVKAAADIDEIDLPVEAWNYPVLTADPYLQHLCVKFCEETLARKTTARSPLKVTVENTIAALLPHGSVRIGKVAKKLSTSPRTLARRLSAEGVSFGEILSELRFALARRYLSDQTLSMSEISWMLGYAENSAFTRAFQRWSGTSPRAARAQQRRTSGPPPRQAASA